MATTHAQRNRRIGVMIGVAVASSLFFGATIIRYEFERPLSFIGLAAVALISIFAGAMVAEIIGGSTTPPADE